MKGKVKGLEEGGGLNRKFEVTQEIQMILKGGSKTAERENKIIKPNNRR